MLQAYLETVIDSQPKRCPLEPGVICHIGRGAQNEIALDDSRVSRSHAMVQCAPAGAFYLTDLGSRNGTFVNGRRISVPVVLQPGDRITIGDHEFLFHGLTDARPAGSRGPGETVAAIDLRLITVLVADIRDFTGLSRRLGEARLSEMIGAFMRESGVVLAAQGAWSQKYIGDAVMAVWLHQNSAPDLREMFAVFAALAKEFEIAAGLQSQFGLDDPVRIGAGINTGLACVGNLGSDTWSDYTALSDAVNLSFRLESATREIGCDLAVGTKTYQFLVEQSGVGPLFEMRTVKLKGYEEPSQVYTASRASVEILLEILRRELDVSSATQPLFESSGA